MCPISIWEKRTEKICSAKRSNGQNRKLFGIRFCFGWRKRNHHQNRYQPNSKIRNHAIHKKKNENFLVFFFCLILKPTKKKTICCKSARASCVVCIPKKWKQRWYEIFVFAHNKKRRARFKFIIAFIHLLKNFRKNILIIIICFRCSRWIFNFLLKYSDNNKINFHRWFMSLFFRLAYQKPIFPLFYHNFEKSQQLKGKVKK